MLSKSSVSFKLNEEKRHKAWLQEIRDPPLKVNASLDIPMVFIDPVVQVFDDPCYFTYIKPSEREVEKFSYYTER